MGIQYDGKSRILFERPAYSAGGPAGGIVGSDAGGVPLILPIQRTGNQP